MLSKLLSENSLILAECAIAERLRRIKEVELHPTLFNTPLIYGPKPAREQMTNLYREYLTIADQAGLPLLLTAPTWRLDTRRVEQAGVPSSINTDAVDYLCGVRDAFVSRSPVLVGALVGPKEDCYRADLSPETEEAEAFHLPQIEELAKSQAEFLLAQTMSSVREARGIARAMSRFEKPYLISFCARPDGSLLDGTRLDEAMAELDSDNRIKRKPEGYSVNCTHPSFFLKSYEPGTLDRLIGIQANGSSKDVTKLDGSGQTEADPVEQWAASMKALHAVHGVPILGGCCGTTARHLKSLTDNPLKKF